MTGGLAGLTPWSYALTQFGVIVHYLRLSFWPHPLVLDYLWPHPGHIGTEVAVVAVGTGRNGRARWFTVFERVETIDDYLDLDAPSPATLS